MINIQENIPLSEYTTFKIGGPARFFMEVKNKDELKEALKHARQYKLPFFVLGGGSNLLISDAGFSGLIIKFNNIGCTVDDNLLECQAGTKLGKIVNIASEKGLSGLEWASGIPGTFGGAVAGNAGAYGAYISDSIEKVNVLKVINKYEDEERNKFSLQVTSYDLKDCGFSYRKSAFKYNKNLIIISAVLNLKPGEKEKIEAKIKEISSQRNERIPQGVESAGCFFENPVVEDEKLIKEFEKDSSRKCEDKKIPAAWLIEEAGFPGKTVGGAKVSEKHANFLVNTGKARAEDIVILASLIKQKVRNQFGIQLKEEVEMVGF